MKFDFCIGNPAYQESMDATSDKPVYNFFMDEAYKIADKVELITPARFLFRAGKTSSEWNEKMLNDKHFKVLFHEQNSTNIFPNTDIKGGVAITYRDKTKDYGGIKVFTVYPELNSLLEKVTHRKDFQPLSELVYSPESYKFSDEFHKEVSDAKERMSAGHYYDIVTNIFTKFPDVFLNEKPEDSNSYIRIIGLDNTSKRCEKWIKESYIKPHENLGKWKVILPKANGSGAIGEVLSTPLVGQPLVGHTQTFISIGKYDTEHEANALFKYIKGKFSRTMLGILKVTQDNKKSVWKFVPLQDFSSNSDIDWNVSIANIDRQLYKKYGLSDEEINFIETHVKEME